MIYPTYKPTRQGYTRNATQQPIPDDAPLGTEVWYQDVERQGKIVSYTAITFTGKAQKPSIFSGYGSAKRRQEVVENWLSAISEHAAMKAHTRQARKDAVCPFKKGDVLQGSWGYDQTNVEFFEIVEAKGRKVTIRELGHATVKGSEGFMCESVVPDHGRYIGQPETHIAQTYSGDSWYIKLHDSCSLSLWEGGKRYKSWYA